MNDDHDPDTALGRRFRDIYEANHAALAAYALRRAASPEDAADVVAETFAVAWRRIAQIPLGRDATLWLFGTARRVLANQRRGERRRARLTLRLRAQPQRSQAGAEERSEDLALAKVALRRLPAAQREVLGLIAWEGLSTAELASVLGCSQNAAKIRLHRARRAFSSELERIGGTTSAPETTTPAPACGAGQSAFRNPSPISGETP